MIAWTKGMSTLSRGIADKTKSVGSDGKGRRVAYASMQTSARTSRSNLSSPRSERRKSSFGGTSSATVSIQTMATYKYEQDPQYPLPVYSWVSLFNALTSSIRTEAAAAQSAAGSNNGSSSPSKAAVVHGVNDFDIDSIQLAASYAVVASERGTLLPKNTSKASAAESMLTLFKSCAVWDANYIPSLVQPDLKFDSEELEAEGLPRRLTLRIVRGSSLVARYMLFRKAWISYREPLEKLIDEVGNHTKWNE